MDSLVGYGSDDEGESSRYGYQPTGGGENTARPREDDTNYDDVHMDMSEVSTVAASGAVDTTVGHASTITESGHEVSNTLSQESQGAESEPELPPTAAAPLPRAPPPAAPAHDGRSRSRSRSGDRRERRRERPPARERHERSRNARPVRRGLLGDRPDRPDRPDRTDHRGVTQTRPGSARVADARAADVRVADARAADGRVPDARAADSRLTDARAMDARDAASPRFVDRRERDRDREGRPRRSEERRGGEPADYRPSYKVNKKLEVMEKMGLQIKTPDGSMATARQLRAGAPYALHSHRILDQVQKRKLLWAHKEAGAGAGAEAARWSGARFAQDSDGKQVSKFMRLMGIKDPAAVKSESVDEAQDPNKKQEELFQAMQAQYEVARATTHTMRGVGLGFQRGNF